MTKTIALAILYTILAAFVGVMGATLWHLAVTADGLGMWWRLVGSLVGLYIIGLTVLMWWHLVVGFRCNYPPCPCKKNNVN